MPYTWRVRGMCMAYAWHMHGGHQLAELHGVPRGGGGGGGVGGVGTSEAAEALRAWLRLGLGLGLAHCMARGRVSLG